VELVPVVLGVVDPRADQADGIPDRRLGQVAAVARHELDDQPPVLLAVIARPQEVARAGWKRDVQMNVSVVLVTDGLDAAGDGLARVEELQALRVIHARQRATGGRALAGWDATEQASGARADAAMRMAMPAPMVMTTAPMPAAAAVMARVMHRHAGQSAGCARGRSRRRAAAQKRHQHKGQHGAKPDHGP
jgi:hypothetical protein